MKAAQLTIFSLVWLAVVGCKTAPVKPPVAETVAVLMFDNNSNVVNAPDIMERLVYLALKSSAYKVIDKTIVKEKLEKAGIVDGGQLAAVDPAKLGKDLGAQALIFGSVESFNYTNIGFYIERKVELSLKLVDVNTGATLWENDATAAHRQLVVTKEEAGREFVKGIADQWVDKLLRTPLQEEAQQATMNTLRTLPGFVFAGFAHDEKTKGEEMGRVGKEISKGTFLKK